MTAHRPARINPDSMPVLVVAVAITSALALTSFLLSYSGLVAVAEWAAVPEWLAWAVPVTIDGAILVYTLSALVFRARGESARVAWASLAGWTAVSVAANGLHAWDAGAPDLRTGLGALIAGLAPVAVLLTTHTIARLIIAPPAPEAVPEAAPAASAATGPEALFALPVEDAKRTMDHARPEWPAPMAQAAQAPEERPTAALTGPERDARIRELDATGTMSHRAIAAAVGCSKSTVGRVLDRPEAEDDAA